MSAIVTGNFASDLLPMVKFWAGEALKMPTYYDKLVSSVKCNSNYHVEAIRDSLGSLQRKNEDSDGVYDTAAQAFTPTYQPVAYALGFKISHEAQQDGNAVLKAETFSKDLMVSAVQLRERIVANLYNNAFAASSVTMLNGDGKTMVASDHPTHGSTQSNLITGGSIDLSEAALDALRIQVRKALNHRGMRTGLMIDKLIVSVDDEGNANRIVYSDGRVATADNDLNWIAKSNMFPGGIVTSPYLTDTDAYFVTTSAPHGAQLLVREEPSIDSSGEFDSKTAKFMVYMRLAAGWTDWRQVYGSAGV